MKMLVLDGNSIINRAFYGIRLLSAKDGTYTNAIYGFLSILLKLTADVSPDAVAVAFDLRAPTFRHKRYDGYKAQRKGMPEELAQQMPILKELLGYLGYTLVEKEGFEADDILGTLAAACAKNKNECVIATGDKDSLQLINEYVTVRLAGTKMGQPETVVYDEAAFRERYGVEPLQLIDLKAIMGDSSDNIPGVKGIGEKGAIDLISRYTSLENIYENLETIDVKPAIRQKLTDNRDMAFLSKELATIFCEVPICTDFECYKRAEIKHVEAARLLARLEMYKMTERLGVNPAAAPAVDGSEGEAPAKPAPLLTVVTPEEMLPLLADNPDAVIDLLCIFEDDSFKGCAALFKNKLMLTESRTVFSRILKGGWGLRTTGCKQIYRYGFINKTDVLHLCFDAELAGYLANPNSKSYSIQTLAQGAGAQTAVLHGELTEAFAAMQDDILVFTSLCDKMADEIKASGQEELLYNIEIPLAQVLASMEIIGFELDTTALTAFGKELDTDLARHQKQIYESAGHEFNINSPAQMGEVLFAELGLPAKKKTKTGYSTNVDVLEGLLGKHPIIESILEYRKLSKLKSTYVDGLLKTVQADGRIHTSFQQTETRTGRISSTEPNLQNIPVRTEIGSNLRKFFCAKEACVLVDADYSQIELRILAHIAQDENMLEAFRTGLDIHTQTASQVFDLPPLFITPTMRSRAKAVNFGIVYGISAFSLSQDIGVSVAEADSYIKGYLKTYSGVKKYMDEIIVFGKEHGYVKTLWGRRRYLPELASSNHNLRSFGERVARNMPIQGSAADIIKIAMVRVYKRLKDENLAAKLILQVHDELLVEAPAEEADIVRKIVKEEMEGAAALSVPLTADTMTGKTWYAAKG
ncbi:MAG: DNA polymerase I [Hydrogenoanaerobacterium sp.]